jgi:hypothetical protein
VALHTDKAILKFKLSVRPSDVIPMSLLLKLNNFSFGVEAKSVTNRAVAPVNVGLMLVKWAGTLTETI